jgi:hypothetical protein
VLICSVVVITPSVMRQRARLSTAWMLPGFTGLGYAGLRRASASRLA